MTINLDNAFAKFKADPTPKTAWELQRLIVSYTESRTLQQEDTEEFKNSYTTLKGEQRDKELNEILDLFSALGAEVIKEGGSKYLEYWVLEDKDGNKARLYLNCEPWTMGSLNKDKLKGVFEGYENKDTFIEFLSDNNIEIAE